MQKKEVVLALMLVLVTLVSLSYLTSSISSGTSENITIGICQNSSSNSSCTIPQGLTCVEAKTLGLIQSSISGGNATITNSANSSFIVGLAVYKTMDSNTGMKILYDGDSVLASYNHTSKLSVDLPNCKYQVDLFCGSPIQNFSTNSVYGTRLIKFIGSPLPFCITPPQSPICGNGIREGTEQCDDGNQNNTDVCNNLCRTTFCGDNITNNNEQCDDGNSNSTDSCSNSCALQICGDGIKQTNEQCDDGNNINNDTCSNTCITQTIACKKDPDCNDNSILTFDQCINANTSLSFCRNTPINCAADLDCGTSGFTGNEFCSINNITKNFQTFQCINPATPNSFCISEVEQKPIQQCTYACSSASCIRCDENPDCNDNNSTTTDQCVNPGTIQSFCQNTPIPIICSQNSDCGISGAVGNQFCSVNNVTQNFINYTCNNPGTPTSFCSNITHTTTQQCQDYCSNGQCNFFICKVNSDCGNITESPRFCENNDVAKNITSPICLNGSTTNAQCSQNKTKQIIEHCDYQCSNGLCVQPPQNITCEEAIRHGILNGSLQVTKGIVINNGSQSFKVGLAIYKIFPGSMANQTLIQLNSTTILGFSNITLTGNAPDCAYQVDLFCGDVIPNFTHGEDYGNRLIRGTYNNSFPFCENAPTQVCGNGIREGTEQCDDNNTNNNDTCSNTCQTQIITCTSNLSCGTNTESNLFCSANSTARNLTSFTCNNANTTQSFCSNITQTSIVEQCSLTCNNGLCTSPVCGNGIREGTEQCDDGNQNNTDSCNNQCQIQNIICHTDNECTDSNPLTFDQCINANTSLSFCRNTPINCATDLDCGTSGFTGNEFCSINNITKNFQTFQCINPATPNSFCISEVEQKPIQQCTYACSSASCIRCDENPDCNDNNNSTLDTCVSPGTSSSYCQNTPPPTIICSQNSDCGLPASSTAFCLANNVSETFTNYTCLNPGTSQSQCSTSTQTNTLISCEFMCSNGQCISNQTNPIGDALFLTIISPENITYTTSFISVIINSNGSNIWFSIDNSTNQSYTQSTIVNLTQGNHQLNAYANTSLGNSTSASVNFVINITTGSGGGGGGGSGHGGSLYYPSIRKSYSEPIPTELYRPFTTNEVSNDGLLTTLNPSSNKVEQPSMSLTSLVIISTLALLIIVIALVISLISGKDSLDYSQ